MSMKNIKWLLGAFSMLLAMTTFTACSGIPGIGST